MMSQDSPASMAQVPQMLPPVPAQPDAGTEVDTPCAQPPFNPSWPALPGPLPGACHSAQQAIHGSDDTRKAAAVLTHFRN